MPNRPSSRIIAVLGMHRGGTSASMRALMCLGVQCGNDLLPGVPDENPRGFFEDEPVLDVCERVLEALGLGWDTNTLIPADAWRNPALSGLELEAAQSIRDRFQGVANWGVKNPRMARLLPFWQRVFARVGRRDSYLIVMRNPISVARSLETRNEMSARQASLLWLLHMTDAVVHSKGHLRVGLDYDQLLASPETQLDRVARALDLPPPDAESEALEHFRDDFLSEQLRTTRFEASDLHLDEATSALVVRAYDLLRRWAEGNDEQAVARLQRGFNQIRRRLSEIEPLLSELTDVEARRRDLLGDIEQRDGQLDELRSVHRVQSDELERRHAAIAQRDQQLALTSQQADVAQREAANAETRAEADRLRAEALLSDVSEARADAAGARSGLEAAAAVAVETQAQLESAHRESAGLLDELQQSRTEVVTLQTELQHTAERLDTQRLEIERAEAERQRVSAEREQISAERDRASAEHQRAEAERQHAAAERKLAEEARARADSDRRQVADSLATLQTELGAVRSDSHLALERIRSENRRDRSTLQAKIAMAEQRAETANETADALRSRLDLAEQTSHALQISAAARHREIVDWVHGRAAQLSRQLIDAADSLERTRTWRLAATLQRGVGRLRGRSWIDGLAQLKRLTRELHWNATRSATDVKHLAAETRMLQETLVALTAGELFRISRRAALVSATLRGHKRSDGPLELLRARSGDLLSYLEQLSVAPFETAGADVETAIESLDLDTPHQLEATVDVVVPVYQARNATLRCLHSVLASHNRTPFELVVIDDGSSDRALHRALDVLATEGRITLVRNETNRGFPVTANRGMALHPTRDVVLLNSDTAVHGDWLDRLRRRAYADWKVATVTPFSNNAEICSYPVLCRSDAMPGEAALVELDVAVSKANEGLAVTLPTAVGFCMYVRREALRDVGDFDADRFERGYGEENDFCLRARERGYQHLLAADVFVAHEGGASFSDARQALIERGLAKLDDLHPGYHAEIRTFIEQDPVLALRRRVDAQRLGATGGSLLMVSHALGGGTERHVGELAAHLEDESTPVILLRPDSAGRVQVSRAGRPVPENLLFDPRYELGALIDTLRQLGVRHVHFHHTLGMDTIIRRLPGELGVDYDVTLHDYVSVCPRVHCVDDSEVYCGVPDAEHCNACVKRNGSIAGFEVDVPKWRADHAALLAAARRVIAPSEDVKRRLSAHLPPMQWLVRPHPEQRVVARHPKPQRLGRRRRVAVIGAIGPHKGSAVLLACAADAAQRELPLEFHVLGYTDRDEELRATGRVTLTGAYEEAELPRLIARAKCHLTLFPIVWPETYCYTLSAAFENRLFPVAFDLGAVADRIRSLGWGDLLPFDSAASEVNDFLLQCEPVPFPDAGGDDFGTELETRYASYLNDYYDDLQL